MREQRALMLEVVRLAILQERVGGKSPSAHEDTTGTSVV
jgi:hypothetical protein